METLVYFPMQRHGGLRPGQPERRRPARAQRAARANLNNMHLIDDASGQVI